MIKTKKKAANGKGIVGIKATSKTFGKSAIKQALPRKSINKAVKGVDSAGRLSGKLGHPQEMRDFVPTHKSLRQRGVIVEEPPENPLEPMRMPSSEEQAPGKMKLMLLEELKGWCKQYGKKVDRERLRIYGFSDMEIEYLIRAGML